MMSGSISFRIRMGWILLLSAVGLVANGSARAQVPVTSFVVIQPIDVCSNTGSAGGCAPFNLQSRNPDPTKATTTTPIGFVDTATNVNLIRAIWLQAGIDVTFLPIKQYNNSAYQTIAVSCTTTSCTSDQFKTLSSGAATPSPLCTINCTVPLADPASNAINMFFVNSLTATTGTTTSQLAGFAWLNGNGVAIASNVFSFSPLVPSRFDTLAHELGHNLNLDHTTFGAGPPGCSTVSRSGCNNLMSSGDLRVVPSNSGCSATAKPNFGALFDLDTGLCATAPATPVADDLLLGTDSTIQQGQVLLSGFLNPIPNVNATAGAGITALASVASALSTTTTGGADISFTVAFPQGAGGRPNEYIFALILALPKGFQFGNNLFFQAPGVPRAVSVKPLFGKQLTGNKNCRKEVVDDDDASTVSLTDDAATIQCLEIDFAPNTFVAGTTVSFTSSIVDSSTLKPAKPAKLTCTPPSKRHCMNLTFAFNDLLAITSAFTGAAGSLAANSQTPNPGVKPLIVNPADFQTVNGVLSPVFQGFPKIAGFPPFSCTSPTITMEDEEDEYGEWSYHQVLTCPPLAHGDPTGPD